MTSDPVVVRHGEALLETTDRVEVVRGDLRRPREILDHPDVQRLIRFDEPVGLLLGGVLGFVDEADNPHGVVAELREVMAAGSYLVLSHGVGLDRRPEQLQKAGQVWAGATAQFFPRTHAEVRRFFEGFELVEPGLVWVSAWRPEMPVDPAEAERVSVLGGVGRRI